jgi:hypothetical protein
LHCATKKAHFQSILYSENILAMQVVVQEINRAVLSPQIEEFIELERK